MDEPSKPHLTPEQETVVLDELLRERIRRLSTERKPQSRWAEVSRHPLVAVALGFCLTGVIGLFLSQSVNAAREEREQRLEDYRSGLVEDREGLEAFASTLFERHTLGTRFLNALDRGATKAEVDARRGE